jgi:hypothetical protein
MRTLAATGSVRVVALFSETIMPVSPIIVWIFMNPIKKRRLYDQKTSRTTDPGNLRPQHVGIAHMFQYIGGEDGIEGRFGGSQSGV